MPDKGLLGTKSHVRRGTDRGHLWGIGEGSSGGPGCLSVGEKVG